MAEPVKRTPEAVKQDMESLLEIYKKSFKDKMVDNPYFDGYRAALDSISEDVKKIPTEY